MRRPLALALFLSCCGANAACQQPQSQGQVKVRMPPEMSAVIDAMPSDSARAFCIGRWTWLENGTVLGITGANDADKAYDPTCQPGSVGILFVRPQCLLSLNERMTIIASEIEVYYCGSIDPATHIRPILKILYRADKAFKPTGERIS